MAGSIGGGYKWVEVGTLGTIKYHIIIGWGGRGAGGMVVSGGGGLWLVAGAVRGR